MIRAAIVALLLSISAQAVAAMAAPAPAAPVEHDAALELAARDIIVHACAAIVSRVNAVAAAAPVFLRSYDAAQGLGENDAPALRTAAFAYDNALAVVALLACDRPAEAGRVGAALEFAALHDTRLRNAYRAGTVGDKVLANGWWDPAQNRWVEDAYQSGTATGNVAWTALALLALHDATGAAHWSDTAARLARWIAVNTRENSGAGGYNGGIDGFDAAPLKLAWRSTEHAIDLAALFSRLADVDASGDWREQALHARAFLDHQWEAGSGHFLIGTLPDGVSANRSTSALDVQWWPLLLTAAAPDWRRAVLYAERNHGVGGGFDFNDDRDGEWLEGTAQAALAYRTIGRDEAALRCLVDVARQISAGGYVYATREKRITTGLAVGSASTSADFYYYRRPHLGATAWAILAADNWNPFLARH